MKSVERRQNHADKMIIGYVTALLQWKKKPFYLVNYCKIAIDMSICIKRHYETFSSHKGIKQENLFGF